MAGMQETLKQADKGMALFAGEAKITFDTDGAQKFKSDHEAAIKAKEDQAAALTGKDNKKARTELSKEASAMKADPKYIDACKVLKGLEAPNGNFMKKELAKPVAVTSEAPKEEKEEKKEEKKKETKKTSDSAGISKAERDELEKLKTDIIARKTELKAQGMSGGQCNKDEEVVKMVARMTELKIKEDPSLAAGDGKKKDEGKKEKKKDSEEKMKVLEEIEEYRMKLKSEFQYTDKEIKADPDMQELVKRAAKLK